MHKVVLDMLALQVVPFHVIGQSYGGKMGAVFTKRLHQVLQKYESCTPRAHPKVLFITFVLRSHLFAVTFWVYMKTCLKTGNKPKSTNINIDVVTFCTDNVPISTCIRAWFNRIAKLFYSTHISLRVSLCSYSSDQTIKFICPYY